ncbi:MAG: recombinase RecA [Planctomycetota bacterium]|nr:recombinase RecA [Planctomycetota bacterium]
MSVQNPPRDNRRVDALKSALTQIEKQFGKGSIMRLGEGSHLEIEGIPTGSLSIDLALGGKGFPRGRVVEVFGPEGSGKTTLCLTLIGNVQKSGGQAAFIDAEHAIDPTYAQKLGVDLDALLLSQPDSGEQALEIAEILTRSNGLDVIVIDSVAALVPKAELEGNMGDTHVGLQARLMSQALLKLTAAVSKSKTSLVFINQIREKIGVMFGNPETTPGGRALKFYSSVRVDVRRIGQLKDGDQAVGTRVRCNIVKNKIAPPFKKAEIDMMFATGISYEGDLLDYGLNNGILERAGSWFSYKGEKLGQGRERAREFLKENPKIAKEIDQGIREKLGFEMPADPELTPDPALEETKKAPEKTKVTK